METAQTDASKKRVLIVEDDLELLSVYEALLGGFQYNVITATDGAVALKQIQSQDMDAILCDLQMPELDGDLFYSAIERAKPHLCNRFIFITGVGDDPKYKSFLQRVRSPVLRKPVHPAQVLDELRRLLKTQS